MDAKERCPGIGTSLFRESPVPGKNYCNFVSKHSTDWVNKNFLLNLGFCNFQSAITPGESKVSGYWYIELFGTDASFEKLGNGKKFVEAGFSFPNISKIEWQEKILPKPRIF